MNIDMLNEGQLNGFNKFKEWLDNKKELNFVVSGYAGTGKTFFISILINHLKSKNVGYRVVAPTGKASTILKKKGIDASTIHKLIYTPVEDNGIITFERKPDEEFTDFSIIFCDESTMIANDVYEELLSLGKRIIFSGDIGQLPPVGEPNDIFNNIDVMLTENMRQKGDENRITELANHVRKGNNLKAGSYGNVVVKHLNSFTNEQLIALYNRADQVLCGRNATRHKINQQLKLDKSHNQISEGDKIICLTNNDDIVVDASASITLCNGLVGTCTGLGASVTGYGIKAVKINFRAEFENNFSSKNITTSLKENNHEMYHKVFDKYYKDNKGKYQIYYKGARVDPNDCIKINQFDLGYCISVHKSQGSEWDNVVIIDESNCFRDDKYKWLYTAMTRAKKKLVILI